MGKGRIGPFHGSKESRMVRAELAPDPGLASCRLDLSPTHEPVDVFLAPVAAEGFAGQRPFHQATSLVACIEPGTRAGLETETQRVRQVTITGEALEGLAVELDPGFGRLGGGIEAVREPDGESPLVGRKD